MNKKLAMVSLAFSAAALLRAEVPTVSNVVYSQDPATRLVTISYTLADAPGIITLDVRTNNTEGTAVSIGAENITALEGDVNKLVTNSASPHTIYWHPNKSWPEHQITDQSVSVAVSAWTTNTPPDYLVLDLLNGAVRYYPSAGSLPKGGLTNAIYKSNWLVMRRIPAAGDPWDMGTTANGEYGFATYETNQPVTLTSDYYIGVFPVTQGQWFRVTGTNNSFFCGSSLPTAEPEYPGRPVERLAQRMIREGANGADANLSAYRYPNAPNPASFIGKLRTLSGGMAFDLPSEAQWEYACRAGTTQGHWNDGSPLQGVDADTNLGKLARFNMDTASPLATLDPENGGTAIVGSYEPNGFGLYDMHGNVFEWCLDNLANKYIYPAGDGAPCTGSGWPVLRGGSWRRLSGMCRSASRFCASPNASSINATNFREYGCRVVINLAP